MLYGLCGESERIVIPNEAYCLFLPLSLTIYSRWIDWWCHRRETYWQYELFDICQDGGAGCNWINKNRRLVILTANSSNAHGWWLNMLIMRRLRLIAASQDWCIVPANFWIWSAAERVWMEQPRALLGGHENTPVNASNMWELLNMNSGQRANLANNPRTVARVCYVAVCSMIR